MLAFSEFTREKLGRKESMRQIATLAELSRDIDLMAHPVIS
jgi:hypothetical protein